MHIVRRGAYIVAMLQVVGLEKSYGERLLFRDVNLALGGRERLGLVGRNGHGKSTLLKIIAGVESADAGSVQIPSHYKVGYLSQTLEFSADSALEEVVAALPVKEGGWRETHRAEAVLTGLGFEADQQALKPQELSGGFQVRLHLAKLLVSDAHLLLLDEPTNYLDILSVRWLTSFLNSWPHELILVTHDRSFMDGVVTHVAGIHRTLLRRVRGVTANYYEQISQDEEVYERTRINQQRRREGMEQFVRRFRAKASTASLVQSRIKMLERMERLEELPEEQTLAFQFNAAAFDGKQLLQASDVGFGYGDAPQLFSGLSFSVRKGDRIGVVGKNGKGKSTLLGVLADELQPSRGSVFRSANLQIGYYGQTNVDRLSPSQTIEAELLDSVPDQDRTRARTIAGIMMFSGDAALKPIRVLSGGERSRVLLGKVIAGPANLLLLDEPTNHLDQESSEALLEALESFPGALMIVTHNELLLRSIAKRLLVFDRGRVDLFEGDYDDFLERVGWGSEERDQAQTSQRSGSLNRKELRRLRADLLTERAQVLKPLEQEVSELEAQITESEEVLATAQQELVEITKDGYGDDAVKLSRLVHSHRERIETLFDSLEERTRELDQVKVDFAERLEALESDG